MREEELAFDLILIWCDDISSQVRCMWIWRGCVGCEDEGGGAGGLDEESTLQWCRLHAPTSYDWVRDRAWLSCWYFWSPGREGFLLDTTWCLCSSGFWSPPGAGRRAGDTGHYFPFLFCLHQMLWKCSPRPRCRDLTDEILEQKIQFCREYLGVGQLLCTFLYTLCHTLL